jgi:hypothetical protein
MSHEESKTLGLSEWATREAVNQKDLNFLSLPLDSSVLATAHAKFDTGEELSPLESSQLVHQEYVNFIIFEYPFYQYLKGSLEKSEWERHRNIVQDQIQKLSLQQDNVGSIWLHVHTRI